MAVVQIIKRIIGALCVLILISVCVMPVYDRFAPWPVASQALEKLGSHHRICVGRAAGSRTTDEIGGGVTHRSMVQRTFVLMKAPVGWPRLVSVTEDQSGKVTVEDDAAGAVFVFFVIILCFLGSWLWLVRPLRDWWRMRKHKGV